MHQKRRASFQVFAEISRFNLEATQGSASQCPAEIDLSCSTIHWGSLSLGNTG